MVLCQIESNRTGRDSLPQLIRDSQRVTILLQIRAKRIIVDPHSKIIERELNSPFVYLRSLVQNLSPPEAGMVVRNMSLRGMNFKETANG